MLAGFIGAKDNGSGGDNWSYKMYKTPVKLSPPTNQRPAFYRPDTLPVAQPAALTLLTTVVLFVSVELQHTY